MTQGVWRVVEDIAADHGLHVLDILEGGRGPVVAQARTIAIRACLALGASDSAISKALGVCKKTIQRARKPG
jgi:hypothetical protein